MSLISNVVLFVAHPADDLVAMLNEPVPDDVRRQQMERQDTDGAGGNKVFTGDVWMAAFNYLDLETFTAWLRDAPWGYANGALIVDHQDGREIVMERFGSEW
jgi:hypothetical protein